jgi:hypothetical protein
MTQEPSYLTLARSNVRYQQLTSPGIVDLLIRRIDDLERQAELLDQDSD